MSWDDQVEAFKQICERKDLFKISEPIHKDDYWQYDVKVTDKFIELYEI